MERTTQEIGRTEHAFELTEHGIEISFFDLSYTITRGDMAALIYEILK